MSEQRPARPGRGAAAPKHMRELERRCRLTLRQMNHRVPLSSLRFETTESLEPLEEVIEQERALQALHVGLRIQKRNFHLYIAGASGTGKSSILKRLLREVAQQNPVPPDWCLVHDFRHPEAPHALSLPPGMGPRLRTMMETFVAALQDEVPKAFHAKPHQERIQRILNDGLEQENRAFLELARDASQIGFMVKQTKEGLMTLPLLDGKPIGNKEYAELSEEQRADVDARRQQLEPLVGRFLQATREIEVGVHRKIQEAQRLLGETAVRQHLEPIQAVFREQEEVLAWLQAVGSHVVENLPRFLPDENENRKRQRPMVEYQVNVLVDHGETTGAPIVVENNPTYHNLVGKIEKRVENGIYSTDHTMVKAGALLRANGGYLVLHIRELLSFPFAWEAVKGVLRNQRLVIEEMGEAWQFLPTTGLRPDPIPVQCKVILIGSNWHYHMLTQFDEDFGKLFQVKAEFDSQMRCNDAAILEYARFVATTCKREGLLPVHRDGVGAVIEYGMRRAGAADRMTLRFNEVTNLLVEADALARGEGSPRIERSHVEAARRQRQHRISLIADRTLEEIEDGVIRIDTEGQVVGVVNGLAVFQIADLVFGRPLRISAKVFQGKAGVINVEREARLSGNTFNKGVMILSGFLGDHFAQKRPLSMTASLTVEQSYGTIDGDSASCAELCALLSALSGAPLRQDLAITGSVSQSGEVQAIGGINEKVEGFFQVCKAKGLTGTQGVILPRSNVRHLVLDPEVLAACQQGRFHLYAVDRVEEAVGLLTGQPAGTREEDGRWTRGSVFARVAERLEGWAERGGKGRENDAGAADKGEGTGGEEETRKTGPAQRNRRPASRNPGGRRSSRP